MVRQGNILCTNKDAVASLNSAQQMAVRQRGTPLLIVAGPGTGKTHTLTIRIHELQKELLSDEAILAVTFTKKAAIEMQTRLKALSPGSEQIFVGTFHQFCFKKLFEHVALTELDEEFKIAAPESICAIIKEKFVDLSRRECRSMMNRISLWKSTQFLENVPQEVVEYDRLLRENGLLDFDDVLLEFYRLLANHANVREGIRQRFPYIFVDEYQDLNTLQHAILRMLVDDDVHVTAIGDPNQAIYGFRGSDVNFFKQFEFDFPGAKVLNLSDNYRSSENLLTASSQVIGKASGYAVAPLTAKIYLEGRLSIYEAPTQKAEAEFVVHQIERLIGGTSLFSQDSGRVMSHEDSQVSFGDIVVLYRLNSQQHALVQAFERMGIPYQVAVKGGDEELDEVCPSPLIESEVDCEKVSLMTLHASKGLEFPVVFVLGCEEKLIPLDLPGLKSDVQEERRLFYVGMTRAKQWLYLLRARKRSLYGRTYTTEPSPFLADIEEDLKSYEQNLVKRKGTKKQDQQITFL